MSQMSHLKQKNGKVLETLPLSPGKTENLRYVLPLRGRRQADAPTNRDAGRLYRSLGRQPACILEWWVFYR